MGRAALLAILLALIAPARAQGLEERACRINFDDCAKDIQAVCNQQIGECNQRHDETVRRCQDASRSNFDACVRWARQNRADPNSTCGSHRRSFDACSDPRTRERACNAAAVRCPTRERCDVNFQLCMRDAAAARQQREQPPPQEAPRQQEAVPTPAPAPARRAPQTQQSALQLGQKLLEAARWGNVAEVERLLAEGAAVNVQDKRGMTPLHLAASGANTVVTELLLRHGASVQMVDAQQLTPLHYAAARNKGAPVAELLLQAGASVRDPNGWTPLHAAARWANAPVVELLLRAEASVNAQDKAGHTPLRLVACSSAFEQAVLETVSLLLKNGADPNLYGKVAPPIHCSVVTSLRVTELLLAGNADPNALDGQGRTPLHVAIHAAATRRAALTDPELIKLLVANGADPNLKGKVGKSPLEMAREIEPPELRQRMVSALGG